MNGDANLIELAAGIILFDLSKEMVLMVKDSKGTWRFPSGRVETAESLLDAAIRELREETGINPGGFKIFMIPLPLVRDKIPRAGTSVKLKLTALFPAYIVDARAVVPANEHEEKSAPEWSPISEAMQRTQSSTRAACIHLAFSAVQSCARGAIAHSANLPENARWPWTARLFCWPK